MKKSLFHKFAILLLALPALACGLLSADPTPTPEPTATTAPTDTPAPTNTPAPTPTPQPSPTTDITADFIPYENTEMGLSLQYPADWAVQDFFVVLLATDEQLFDAPEAVQEGAVMVVAADTTETLGDTDPVALVNEAVGQFSLSADAAIVDGPNPVVIQGQDAAVARIEGTSDATGDALVGLVTVIINGDNVGVSLGFTPKESESQYLPVIQAIMNTIVVSQPEETGDYVPGNPPTADNSIPLAVGDTFPGTLETDSPQAFIVTGQADSPINILVNPLNDELDLLIEIFDADSNSLTQVDESFSGEAEETTFIPPADGDYFIQVEDYYGMAGDFEISLSVGEAQAPIEPVQIEPGHLVEGSLTGQAAEYLFPATAGQSSVIFVIPDENLDATVTIKGSDGEILVDEVDHGFAGKAEALTFTPEADGEYHIIVDAFAVPEGDYTLFVSDPTSSFTADGEVEEGASQNFRACVPANAGLVVFVEPAEGFDAIVDFRGAGGGQLVDTTDSGFSGEPEAAVLTIGADSSTDYPIIVSVGGFGGQGGSFSILIGSTSSEPVVIDGC
ncbi:MAG: hypothetical protein WAM60_11720 [Candidatus Promineifilaceae bacterium]